MNSKNLSYRYACLIVSLVALALAFVSKFYSGPYWRFADAYLGDVFIIICLYFWLTIMCVNLSIVFKALMIAALATVVELFQLSGIPTRWDLPEPFVFILGSSFDPKDFIYYAIGLCGAVGIDILLKRRWS